MVRWFIEKQANGLDEQGPGQRDAHPPASRKVLRLLGLHLVGEAQPGENGSGPDLGRVGIEGVQALVDGVEGVHDFLLELLLGFFVLLTAAAAVAVVLRLGEFLGVLDNVRHELVEILRLLLELVAFFVDGHDGFQRRQRVAGLDLFLQEKNVDRLRDGQGAGPEGPQQGRLAAPVATDEPVAVSVIQHHRGFVEEDRPHVLEGDVRDADVPRAGVHALPGGREGADGARRSQRVGGLVVDPVVGASSGFGFVGYVQCLHLGGQVLLAVLRTIGVGAAALGLVLGGLLGLAFLLGQGLFLFFGELLFEELVVASAHGRISHEDTVVDRLVLSRLQGLFEGEFRLSRLFLVPLR
mmetsp:Transcript_17166/g.39642  ORF Transcript_17166/g.39642 Transcript_17166/m.39642 type:complete len:353 (-) Transcript_17166:129-1187(-)